jgi:hypothetical protein
LRLWRLRLSLWRLRLSLWRLRMRLWRVENETVTLAIVSLMRFVYITYFLVHR